MTKCPRTTHLLSSRSFLGDALKQKNAQHWFLIPTLGPPRLPPSHASADISPPFCPRLGLEVHSVFLTGISHHTHTHPACTKGFQLLSHESAILVSSFNLGVSNHGTDGVQNKSLTPLKALTRLRTESTSWGGMFYGLYLLVSGPWKRPGGKHRAACSQSLNSCFSSTSHLGSRLLALEGRGGSTLLSDGQLERSSSKALSPRLPTREKSLLSPGFGQWPATAWPALSSQLQTPSCLSLGTEGKCPGQGLWPNAKTPGFSRHALFFTPP